MSIRWQAGFVLIVAFVGWVYWLNAQGDPQQPQLVWGQRGYQPGDFGRPRAIAIDPNNRMFIVDFTARIQCFTLDGQHTGLTWTTPDYRNGRPSGLSIDRDGNLLVADSHYHTVRIYNAEGQELRHFGGEAGNQPGQFGYVSDCVQDADGFYYIAEFGQNDRITKLDADGNFLQCWGEQGHGPLQFNRVRALALGPDGYLYAADACNHRIQVMTKDGEYVREIGTAGSGLGQFSYPYDLAFNSEGLLYIAEYGNHRIQKLNRDGIGLATWGSAGRGPGQLANPWALGIDAQDRIHVVDTENHRVQRIKF